MSSKNASTSNTSSSPTSILDLPAEIRMQILAPLVQNHSEISIAGFRNDKHNSQMSLFYTCRTISDDCCELMYGTNEFHLSYSDLGPLVKLVNKIGVHNAQRIRKLTMRANCFHFVKSKPNISRNATSLCQLLPGIERLELWGIGPIPSKHSSLGPWWDRAAKFWRPSHLKAVETWTKKPSCLLDGKVYITHEQKGYRDRSAIIYRKDSNLIISKHVSTTSSQSCLHANVV